MQDLVWHWRPMPALQMTTSVRRIIPVVSKDHRIKFQIFIEVLELLVHKLYIFIPIPITCKLN